MTNTERIQANNANLRECIETAEALPDMGEPFAGEYTIIPTADEAQILKTSQKVMTKDLTIEKIPYYEVSNTTGGKTATIA
jgi:hypothetical protein